jgi:hypothetical protein
MKSPKDFFGSVKMLAISAGKGVILNDFSDRPGWTINQVLELVVQTLIATRSNENQVNFEFESFFLEPIQRSQ